MPVVAVAALMLVVLLEPVGQVVAAQVVPIPLLERLAQLILAVAVVAAVMTAQQLALAAQAALASSSSNTTSALPQSSPSSHRRSGLHRLVRSALTTSL
jgi:hypothetical protein